MPAAALTTVCAWCQKTTRFGGPDSDITHTICATCETDLTEFTAHASLDGRTRKLPVRTDFLADLFIARATGEGESDSIVRQCSVT